MPISLSGSLNLSGSLTTTGTITATTLVVQTITSSISSITGSTNFGSLVTDTHKFTGSLNVTGSVNVVGLNTIGSNSDVAGGGFGTTTLSNSQTVVAGTVIGTYQGAYAFIDLATQASAGSWMDFSSGSGDDYQGRIRYNNGTQQMNFYTSASATPLFNIGGTNVGIGTTAPSALLHIYGTPSADTNLKIQNSVAGYANGIQLIAANDAGAGYNNIGSYTNGGNTHWLIGSGATTNTMVFYTNNNVERMRITNSGSIGIGCTPGSITSLDIQNASATSNNVFLRLQNNAASEDCGIIISGSFGTAVEHRIGINTVVSSKDLTFSNSNTAGYRWYTDGTQTLTLASNGLVSIANTFASSNFKLGVSGSAHINGTNNKGIFITDNATYASVVGLNSAISAYNPIELRGSGTDYQLYLNTDGRVFINANASSAYFDGKVNSYGEGSVPGACFKNAGNSQFTCAMWNAATSGDNPWITFVTETSPSVRGGIDYNRAGGVVRYNTSSDVNLKNIIGYSDKQKSIDILNSTKIREFSWKEDKTNKSQIGVIAQELYETFKGAVSVGSDESLLGTEDYKTWAVDKTAFTFHLIAGWQKHEQLIQELTARVQYLENK